MNPPCNCVICCSPCKVGCLEEMRCRSLPPCNAFVDPVTPCDKGVYKSPICNEKLVQKGAECGKFLFCDNGKTMKYYTADN